MTVRATVYEQMQFGKEAIPGTAVDVERRLLSLQWSLGPEVEVQTFRPSGLLFPIAQTANVEHFGASYVGPLTYTELLYLVESMWGGGYKEQVPDKDAWDRTWEQPAWNEPVDSITWTAAWGNEEFGTRSTYVFVNGLRMAFSRRECTVEGDVLGRAADLETPASTEELSEVDVAPVLGNDWEVYLGDDDEDVDANPEPAVIRVKVGWDRLRNLFFPLLRDAGPVPVTVAPRALVSLLAVANGEEAGVLLARQMRTGATKFVRLFARGPAIETGVYNEIDLQMATKIGKPKRFTDEDGVYAMEWPLELAFDQGWQKTFSLRVRTGIDVLYGS